jgi:anti-anti-sigma factor
VKISELDGVKVAAFGDDDFGNPHMLEDAFEHLIGSLGKRELVADLSRVGSVTSLGVAVIVAAQGIAMIHDTRLAFAGVRPRVRKILDMVGVDKTLSLHSTVDDALAAVKGKSPAGTGGGNAKEGG